MTLNSLKQISAKRGPDLRFVVKANTKFFFELQGEVELFAEVWFEDVRKKAILAYKRDVLIFGQICMTSFMNGFLSVLEPNTD